MADRDLVRQPANAGGGLETGARPYDPPLLPYEIALIEALGCTEQEYRQFVRHAQLQARIRPAEYAHVPDVQNDVVSIVVSLVIGLALSAVSTLLAPKAPALESPAKIRGKKLADQIGPSRFNQTTSFDNVSSLAEYGQPIPIPFGKRDTGADGLTTGGLTLAPALVWSRLYANGSFQSFEGIYVAGQHGMITPQIGGIRLGTTALSTLDPREYALYWSSNDNNNRPSALIYGTQGNGATGTVGRQVFTAPTNDGQFSPGFSMAYNPANQVAFGTSSPIHNGTAFRFNWEIISAPYDGIIGSDNADERAEIQARRRKIAGHYADALAIYDGQTKEERDQVGQPGVGRQYSRRMGIISVNGTAYSVRSFADVSKDSTAIFTINYDNWQDFQREQFEGTEVNLKDLKSSAKSWRERAADLLAIGSKWIIGATVWVVESRSGDEAVGRINVVMRCVEVQGVARIGVPGSRTIDEPLAGYDGGEFNPDKNIGAGFYSLCRYHEATIRPVRRDAEVIEIGIRSQVWNRANGLCNFNAIPTPDKLRRLDRKNISLSTPRMDKYFTRTSLFAIFVRPVQVYGQPESQWARIPEIFCVTGSAPVDQFNFLRIRPRNPGYYEYRLVPKTGADMVQHGIDQNMVVQLDAQGIEGDANFGRDYDTPYGAFRVGTKGREVYVGQIKINEEMFTDPQDATFVPVATQNAPAAVDQFESGVVSGSVPLWGNAFLTHYLGYAPSLEGQTRTANIPVNIGDGRTVTLQVKASAIYNAQISQTYLSLTGNSRVAWRDITYTVITSTGTWQVGDVFNFNQNVSNTFGNGTVYFKWRVTAIQTITPPADTNPLSRAERVFEENSQIADVSFYQELSKSNESSPEHEIVYINEYISNDELAQYYGMSTLAIAVKSSSQVGSVGQLRAWMPSGINVSRLLDGGDGPSNLFSDLVYYLLTSKSQGVGNTVPAELVDTDSLITTGRFLRANKIFYDGVVEDSESLRSFLYDNATLQLCNFTIKNGRFGMMPALPYDSNYVISTSPIPIEQIFTSGNIIEDSLQVQYIDAAQRSNFRAIVSWRQTIENDLPTQVSALVDWADIPESSRATTQQSFDLSDFCTNRAQALATARFLMSVRRRITHTINFKTVPDALGIQPGSYIRVITAATTYSSANNGAITDAGTLVSVGAIADGTYNAMVYNPATSAVLERPITINNNIVTDSSLYGTLFTLLSETVSKGVYQVEQLTLDEDGLVNVAAVHVPVDNTGASIVAKDVLTAANFRLFE